MEVASCAPFGLLWWAREIWVPLPRPLHVAPRLGEPGPLPSLPESSIGDAPLRSRPVPVSPAAYAPTGPGTPAGPIHWPATSHVGSLMVREKERQTDDPVVVDLALPPDPVAAEAESERVMAALAHHLVRGRPVVLGTVEADGHVVRVVRDRIDLGRRLARAVGSPSAGRRPPGPAAADGGRGPAARVDVTLWQRVVQANKPGPPEHSVPFRVASAATVVVAAAACWSQGELAPGMAVFAMVATVVGNTLSYRRRERPWPAVKPILAVCALGGFAWFITTVSRNATPGDISTVESPLAVLFAWVLSTHSFDVPARRDVAYSLAGSAALMAVAAAQSVDLTLGVYVVAWLVLGVWALVAMWQSMTGTRGIPWLAVGVAGTAVVVLAALLVAVLPAPTVSTSLIFPSSAADSSPVDSPSNLTDGSPSLPAHAASPNGPTRVGGFLGFAKSLDTGVRAALGDQVVMRVRASRPSFWVGQTYDTWNGQSWLESVPTKGRGVVELETGSPFEIPLAPGPAGGPIPRATPMSRPSTWPSRGRTWSSTPTMPSGSTSSRAPSP